MSLVAAQSSPVPTRSNATDGFGYADVASLPGDDLDSADGALAPAQDQVTTVEQIFTTRDGAYIRDLLVVQVSPPSGDGPAGRGDGGHDARRRPQVRDGGKAAAVGAGTGARDLEGNCSHLGGHGGERALVEFGQGSMAEQGLAGRDHATGLVRTVHQRGELLGEPALAEAGGGPLGAFPHQRLDLLP